MSALVALDTVRASSFRFGTISWVRQDECNSEGCWKANKVEFNLQLAYGLGYRWGSHFREQWAVGPAQKPLWTDAGSCYSFSSCSMIGTSDCSDDWNSCSESYQLFDDQTEGVYTGNGVGGYYVRFAVGRGDYTLSYLNDRICTSPYDTGDKPTCPEGVSEGTPVANLIIDSECSAGVNQSTWRKAAGLPGCATYIPYDLNASAGDMVPCEVLSNSDPDYCSPWAETYGFFFGDGSSTDVILTVTQIEHQQTASSYYMRGESTVLKTYVTSKDYSHPEDPSFSLQYGRPWRAFFTGGARPTTLFDSHLHNNAGGRFRLEVTVNIVEGNRSPVGVVYHPVLPVPYNSRGSDALAHGMLSNFQVSAYDPDNWQTPFFFMGNAQTFGYLLPNQVPEGTFPSLWYEAAYESKRESASYPPWSISTNLAHPPERMSVNAYTGVVQWETGVNPSQMDTAAYLTDWDRDGNGLLDDVKGTVPDPLLRPLPQGLYHVAFEVHRCVPDKYGFEQFTFVGSKCWLE
ncbi:hypothetical protein CYMTET_7287 [Cymbomonas tetramitiformis]|uniref:Uncharacterized protein n=1 Tax=Cymbomonas tetramitiformis TaxID=36881 RepID=A0AAE0GVS7_9CHLO|nr:hypothetical protein CYMTET_7287 [Cymbomonas tetramitiformis]